VSQIPAWLIEGIPFGCVYALIAIGIVLTYKTTGVFNFAFAAQAFLAGAVYVKMVEVHGNPRWLGFVVAVLLVSPVFGLFLDRVLFRAMRTAAWQVKLVTVLGIFVALPEIVKLPFIAGPQPIPVTEISSIPRMLGITASGFHIGTHFVAWDFTMTAIITVALVLVLGFIFRYTAIGLQMRAVVESPRMVELAGVNSERVSAVAWMLSSVLAGIAGVLLATLAQSLDSGTYILLLVVTIAAAAVGRLQSLPITLAAGIALGVADRALPDVLHNWFGLSSSGEVAQDVRPSLPFLVLFLVLVLVRSIRRRESADPLAGVDPPPPAMAHTYKTPEVERLTKIAFPVFIVGFIVAMLTIVSGLWVLRLTDGLTLAVIFLSITIITGFAGQISLAQATFAGLGGFTAADLAVDHGVPIMVGIVLGALVAAAAGALFALPALRLGGIYLTLATLAFGLMVENVVFNRSEVSNGNVGVHMPRPSFAQSDRSFFLFVFAIFAVVAFAVILIRKGTTGRFFMAIRGSEAAAASIGINATALRVTLFAVASAVAGIGGALFAMVAQDIRVGQGATFPTILGIAWVVLVVTLGTRTVDGAVNAGISFVVVQWLLQDALHLEPGIFLILFGLGAITYARHPEGIVEYNTRKSIVQMGRARALNARAKAYAAARRLPESYTRVATVVVPCAAGPALYLAYLLARSLIENSWAKVHTVMLLAFILPSVVFLLLWLLRADRSLRRQGGTPRGGLVMLGGAAVGAGGGALLHFVGHSIPLLGNLPGSILDDALGGVAAGAAFTMFLWLPAQVERAARTKGWLDLPMTVRDGIVPASFIALGTYVVSRMTAAHGIGTVGPATPPSGWPVVLVVFLVTVVWLQAVASIQGAVNEVSIGQEGEVRAMAEGREEPAVALEPPLVPAPAGGSE
jgi:branched-chain amino acid transport system permease protein